MTWVNLIPKIQKTSLGQVHQAQPVMHHQQLCYRPSHRPLLPLRQSQRRKELQVRRRCSSLRPRRWPPCHSQAWSLHPSLNSKVVSF